MKKQLTALVLCICMVLSVLPFSSTQAAAEETSSVGTSNISIGDYIRLGNYNGQPILWRCVDVDEMGPLMLSDQVLATMAYDAKTSENSATRSHSRNLKRGTYGSNQWRDSSRDIYEALKACSNRDTCCRCTYMLLKPSNIHTSPDE